MKSFIAAALFAVSFAQDPMPEFADLAGLDDSATMGGTETMTSGEQSTHVTDGEFATGQVDDEPIVIQPIYLPADKASVDAGMRRGVHYRLVNIGETYDWNSPMADLSTYATVYEEHIDQINLPSSSNGFHDSGVANHFGVQLDGYIDIKEKGSYQFALESDDGSILYMHDDERINNDFGHGMKQVNGEAMLLDAGLHAFKLDFTQGYGPWGLIFKMADSDGNFSAIPFDNLYYDVPEGTSIEDYRLYDQQRDDTWADKYDFASEAEGKEIGDKMKAWYANEVLPVLQDHRDLVYRYYIGKAEKDNDQLLATCDAGTQCRI